MKLKKIIIGGAASCMLFAQVAMAEVSPVLTVSVPGLNGSLYGVNNGDANVTKSSSDVTATFVSSIRTSYTGMDARVVDTNKSPKSSWARGMYPREGYSVATTATRGLPYNYQISSGITQMGYDTLQFFWSPDIID